MTGNFRQTEASFVHLDDISDIIVREYRWSFAAHCLKYSKWSLEMQHRDRYTEWDDEIIRFYEAGWSIREIAKRIHWSPGFVRNRLIRHSIPLRSRGGNDAGQRSIDPHLVEQAKFLYHRLGWRRCDVAQHLGVCDTTISRYLNVGGAPPRPRGRGSWRRR